MDDDRAHDDVEPGELVLIHPDAFLDDGGLEVELHPGRDGRSDQADDHGHLGGPEVQSRVDKLVQNLAPIRLHDEARDDVGDVEHAGHQENLLDLLVRALDHHGPDQDCADGHRDEFADAEHLHPGGDPGELGDHVAHVGQKHADHQVERDLGAEFLADQVRETLAGHNPHARAHFLHHDQGNHDRDQRPDQLEPILGARQGIRGDAAGVIVHVGGDDPGPHEDEKKAEVLPKGPVRVGHPFPISVHASCPQESGNASAEL